MPDFVSLTTAEDAAAVAAFNAVITAQHVTALSNAVTNWATLTATQKDLLLQHLCVITIAIMQAKFAVMS